MPATAVQVPQKRETVPTAARRDRFAYRFAYGRSADSRAHDAPGQDYVAFSDDGVRFAFAVCDGVSQSFLGDVAARIVGDELVPRLLNASPGDDAAALREMLAASLSELTVSASRKVTAVPLPPDSPPMLVEVLEQKRELGSESTFAAGLIDPMNDRLVLTWLGDSRIRVWGKTGELTEPVLGDTFLTRERWSTSRGPIGQPHVFVGLLRDVQRVAAYSDGLPMLDEHRDIRLSNLELAACMSSALQSSTSDDMSYLEIVPSSDRRVLDAAVKAWGPNVPPSRKPDVPEPEPVALPAPRGVEVWRRNGRISAAWAPVVGASHYEVAFAGAERNLMVREPRVSIGASRTDWTPRQIRVRAMADQVAGRWSAPFDIPRARTPLTHFAVAGAAMLLVGLCVAGLAVWLSGRAGLITDFSKAQALAGAWSTRAEPGTPGQNAQCNDLDRARASVLMVAGAPANASLHAQLKLTSRGTDPSIGLVARVAATGNNYYLATLSPNGVVALRKVLNGTATLLASGQINAPAESDWPLLRLDVTSDRLQVLAGNDAILDVNDATLADGGVGLWAGAGSTACFGEVYVRPL